MNNVHEINLTGLSSTAENVREHGQSQITSRQTVLPHVNTSWDVNRKLIFVRAVFAKQAFKKTDLTFKAKYEMVRLELMKNPDFMALKICSNSLQNTYTRMKEATLQKYGFTSESVNLSAVKEQPSDWEQLILEMAILANDEQKKRKYKSDVDKQMKKASNIIAQEGLLHQGVINNQESFMIARANTDGMTTPLNKDSASTTAGSANSSNNSSKESVGASTMAMLSDMRSLLMQAMKDDEKTDDIDKELRRELIRAQIESEKAKTAFFNSKNKDMFDF